MVQKSEVTKERMAQKSEVTKERMAQKSEITKERIFFKKERIYKRANFIEIGRNLFIYTHFTLSTLLPLNNEKCLCQILISLICSRYKLADK